MSTALSLDGTGPESPGPSTSGPLLSDHRLCGSGVIQSEGPTGLGGGQGHAAQTEGGSRGVAGSFPRRDVPAPYSRQNKSPPAGRQGQQS